MDKFHWGIKQLCFPVHFR